MKSFTDNLSRVWVIDLTVGCLRRVKAEIEVDLIAPEAMVDELGKADATKTLTLAQRLTTDIMLFVDVLFQTLKVKTDELGLTVHQFVEAIPPTVLRDARTAFLGEWQAFFQTLGRNDQAAVIQAALDLVNEQSRLTTEATQRLAAAGVTQLKTESDKVVAEAMQQMQQLTSGTSSTSSPASSESTPSH